MERSGGYMGRPNFQSIANYGWLGNWIEPENMVKMMGRNKSQDHKVLAYQLPKRAIKLERLQAATENMNLAADDYLVRNMRDTDRY